METSLCIDHLLADKGRKHPSTQYRKKSILSCVNYSTLKFRKQQSHEEPVSFSINMHRNIDGGRECKMLPWVRPYVYIFIKHVYSILYVCFVRLHNQNVVLHL